MRVRVPQVRSCAFEIWQCYFAFPVSTRCCCGRSTRRTIIIMMKMMMQRLAGNFKHHDHPDSPRSTEMTTIDITEGGPEIIHEAASSSTREFDRQSVLSNEISAVAEDAWSTSEVQDGADPYINEEWRVAVRLGGRWSQSGAAATSDTLSHQDTAISHPPARTCRICTEPETEGNSNPILVLGCQCRDELGQAHQACLEEWFASRQLLPQQLRTCEICRTEMSAPIMSLIDNALPRVAARYAGRVPWGQDDNIQPQYRNCAYKWGFAFLVLGGIIIAGICYHLVIGKPQEGYL